MNIGGGGLRPCEVRITANRKRVANAAGGSYGCQPEPLPVQIKRKNCPYVYRRDDLDAENVGHSDNAFDNEPLIQQHIEPPSDIPHHDGSARKPSTGGTGTMLEEMARLYPDLSVANLQALIKSAENARNQASSSSHPTEPQAVKCSRIPADWGLKTSLLLNLPLTPDDNEFMVQVRKCGDSDVMAKAIISFIDSYSTSSKSFPSDCRLASVLSAIRASSKMWCVSCISLVNNGTVSRHARSSLQSARTGGSEQTALFDSFIKELNAKWLTGLLSVFNLTKLQLCPYFYVVDDRITALIAYATEDAPGDPVEGNPFSKLVATVAPAPIGLLSWLRNSKVNFTSVNEHGVEVQVDGAVVQDSEEALDDDADNGLVGEDENSKTGAQDEADSLSYFEELGVASMILENLKADGKVAEKKKQPLTRAVVIRGRAVLSFVNLLVETRGFPDRSIPPAAEAKRISTKSEVSNSSSRFPLPVLMAPIAFDCASISSFRVRISVNNAGGSNVAAVVPPNTSSDGPSLSMQVTGGLPLPPFVLHRIFGCLTASGRSFSAQADTWLAKSQADHLNASLASIPIIGDKESASTVIDKTANPKTFSATSFSSGIFSLPAV